MNIWTYLSKLRYHSATAAVFRRPPPPTLSGAYFKNLPIMSIIWVRVVLCWLMTASKEETINHYCQKLVKKPVDILFRGQCKYSACRIISNPHVFAFYLVVITYLNLLGSLTCLCLHVRLITTSCHHCLCRILRQRLSNEETQHSNNPP